MAEEKSELQKWSDVHEDWVTIQTFLDHLTENQLSVCKPISDGHEFFPLSVDEVKEIFYKRHAINAMKLEEERRQALEDQRAINDE